MHNPAIPSAWSYLGFISRQSQVATFRWNRLWNTRGHSHPNNILDIDLINSAGRLYVLPALKLQPPTGLSKALTYGHLYQDGGWWRIDECHLNDVEKESDMYSKVCLGLFQAQLIAQSIGQAFQVAYMEFLKANGIEDPGLMKEMDYQEVLNQQEIFGEELYLFANKEMQKEVCFEVAVEILSMCSWWFLLALLLGHCKCCVCKVKKFEHFKKFGYELKDSHFEHLKFGYEFEG